jgi:hypothetical protein
MWFTHGNKKLHPTWPKRTYSKLTCDILHASSYQLHVSRFKSLHDSLPLKA